METMLVRTTKTQAHTAYTHIFMYYKWDFAYACEHLQYIAMQLPILKSSEQ